MNPGRSVQSAGAGLHCPMQVRHEEGASRFVADTEHGEAVVDYVRTGDRVDFTHTYVPPAARNRGLAEALVRQALDWARGERLEVEASCWYVARFIAARQSAPSEPLPPK